MPADRTDEQIRERLGELLTQQEDLQEQLEGLTAHLRGELAALGGARKAEPPRHVDLDHVLDLLGRLAVAPTEADAVDIIVSAARQLLPGTRGALFRVDGDSDPGVSVGVWDPDTQWNRSYQGRPTETPPKRLAGRVAAGPTGQARTYAVRGFGLRLGELRIWPEDGSSVLGADVLDGRAELLARSAGLVLGGMDLQRRLRHNTVRDALTGLFNRRYLLDTLERELHATRRRGSRLALVMLDIDRFGQFNDRYGHEAGNHMLEQIADLMMQHFRASDVCCRYSGERFALLLPESRASEAARRGTDLVAAIGTLQCRFAGQPLEPVKVSAGVAAFPEHADNVADLLAAAESGIALSRQAGGDTLMLAERG
jgi:diguanylate cyclase (GGDEF)-like protein